MTTTSPAPISRRLCACTLAAVVAVAAACSADTPQSLMASGQQYMARKDYKAAAIQFKSALRQDPASKDARLLLGQALLESGDPASALVELSKAFDQKVPADKVMPLLSRALLLAGDYKKLTSLYGDMTLTDPQAMAALKSNIATAWGALGDKANTDAAIAAALTAKPDFEPALLLNARQLAGRRDYAKASAMVDALLARAPTLHEAWMLKGEIAAVAANDMKAAEADFRKALSFESAYVPAHAALIALQLSRSDMAAAKAQADQLRAVLPRHPQTLYADALIAFREHAFVKARESAQQLLRIAPDHVEALQLAGAIEGQLGALALAEAHFFKALSIDPTLSLSRRNLAQIYLAMGQPAKALDALQPLMANDTASAEAYAVAGEAQLRLGDARAAEASFLKAARLKPDDTQIRTMAALTRLSSGDPQAAFAELSSLAASSKDTYPDLALVSAHFKRLEFSAALAALDAVDKKAPNQASTWELRGNVQLAKQDYAGARTSFEHALQINPAWFAATANLAALDQLENKPDQADRRLQASLQADPRNHYASSVLAKLRESAGAPLEDVRAILADAIKNSPTEAKPRLQLIDLLLRKRRYKDALSVAREAAAALPGDVAMLDAVGRAQVQAGDLEQAISTFRRLAGTNPTSPAPYLRLADIYRSNGQRAMAETALKKALEIAPSQPAAQLGLLEHFLGNNRSSEALALSRTFQKQHPDWALGYILEGAVHTRTKATDAALAVYRKGLAAVKDPSDISRLLYVTLVNADRNAEADRFGAERLKAHPEDASLEYQIGSVAINRGDLEGAEAHLRRAVATRTDNALAMNNLAWVLATRGKPGASTYARRAVDMMPNEPAIIDTLAFALAAEQQYAQALVQQRRAIELAPNDNGLHLNLARIALQAGDKALARAELERLRGLDSAVALRNEVDKLMKTL